LKLVEHNNVCEGSALDFFLFFAILPNNLATTLKKELRTVLMEPVISAL